MTAWWLSPTPLKNDGVSWDDYSIPNMMGKLIQPCSKPPTKLTFTHLLRGTQEPGWPGSIKLPENLRVFLVKKSLRNSQQKFIQSKTKFFLVDRWPSPQKKPWHTRSSHIYVNLLNGILAGWMLIYTDKQWIVQVNWGNYPTRKTWSLCCPTQFKSEKTFYPPVF